MITVFVQTLQDRENEKARDWLYARGVRLLGFGGKRQGNDEVVAVPHLIQSVLDGPPDSVGYNYHFSDDLAELAMLFKLTFA